jgi:transcriptional regulator with XRE-family HTH domain
LQTKNTDLNNTQKELERVCENIRGIRELKGISRDYMAFELDITASGYGKIERGEVDLSLKKLFQIAFILEVELGQLLNADASQVFNISHNKNVQGVGAQSQTVNYHGHQESPQQNQELSQLRAELDSLREIILEIKRK